MDSKSKSFRETYSSFGDTMKVFLTMRTQNSDVLKKDEYPDFETMLSDVQTYLCFIGFTDGRGIEEIRANMTVKLTFPGEGFENAV